MKKMFDWFSTTWGVVVKIALAVLLIVCVAALFGWIFSHEPADNSNRIKALEIQTEQVRENELAMWKMIDSTGRIFRAAQRRIDSLDKIITNANYKITAYDRQLETIRIRLKTSTTSYRDSSKTSILNSLPD